MIRCVISDLGKVVLFFDNHIFFRRIARYCPYSAQDIAGRVHHHLDLVRAFDRGKISAPDFYKEVVQRLEARIEKDAFFQIYNDVFSLNLPVLDLLRNLRTGYRMILLSNTDEERFGFIKKRFPEIFLFDDYVLSYEVGYMKPHPQIYREALAIAGVSAAECVFLDDLQANIEGAKGVGMNAILYEPRTDLTAEMKRLGVTIQAAPPHG